MDKKDFEKQFLEEEKNRMLGAFYRIFKSKFTSCGLSVEEMAEKLCTTSEHIQGLLDGAVEPNINDILNFSILFDHSPSEMFDKDLMLEMFGFNAIVHYLYTYGESRSEMYNHLTEGLEKYATNKF